MELGGVNAMASAGNVCIWCTLLERAEEITQRSRKEMKTELEKERGVEKGDKWSSTKAGELKHNSSQ